VADARIEDQSMREEIDLLAEVMIAAGQGEVPLTRAQVDEILGLHPHRVAR